MSRYYLETSAGSRRIVSSHGYGVCYEICVMDPAVNSPSTLLICAHCGQSQTKAVVAETGTCGYCGHPVNSTPSTPHPGKDILQRQLKENDSQRTEVTGYINQLSIQLHRWKIRLQTLNERRADLETQLKAIQE